MEDKKVLEIGYVIYMYSNLELLQYQKTLFVVPFKTAPNRSYVLKHSNI
jgi:hypothetical protein